MKQVPILCSALCLAATALLAAFACYSCSRPALADPPPVSATDYIDRLIEVAEKIHAKRSMLSDRKFGEALAAAAPLVAAEMEIEDRRRQR